MKNISLAELEQWRVEGKRFTLIDVREPFEYEHFNIGGQNIPLSLLYPGISGLAADEVIVLYCAKGIRSVIGLQKLEAKGYTEVYNLAGGIQFLQDH